MRWTASPARTAGDPPVPPHRLRSENSNTIAGKSPEYDESSNVPHVPAATARLTIHRQESYGAAGCPKRMSMPQPAQDLGPPSRRGPSVDVDPTGIVTRKDPDRQRRQFLNYSFYRLDPVFRRLPADERRAAGTEFIELVRKWESSEDLILRTYSLVGLRAGVDFMFWQIA